MQASLEEYKEEMNPARSFLQNNMEENTSGLVQSATVFRIYKKWAEENGYRPLSERPFGKEIGRIFRQVVRVKRGPREDRQWAYEGIQFTQDQMCGEKTNEATLF